MLIRPRVEEQSVRGLFWLSGMDVMYVHDGSENMEDSFILQLTDGRHQLDREVMVRVEPVNDEEPQLVR